MDEDVGGADDDDDGQSVEKLKEGRPNPGWCRLWPQRRVGKFGTVRMNFEMFSIFSKDSFNEN